MKKLVLVLFLVASHFLSFAQWEDGAALTNSAYLQGYGAIGTLSLDENIKLLIAGSGTMNGNLSPMLVLNGSGTSSNLSLQNTDGSGTLQLNAGVLTYTYKPTVGTVVTPFSIDATGNTTFNETTTFSKTAAFTESATFSNTVSVTGALDASSINSPNGFFTTLGATGTSTFNGLLATTINTNKLKAKENLPFIIEASSGLEMMNFGTNGNVGIGTVPSNTHKLAVNGSLNATEVKVTTTIEAPDYVFEENYELKPLSEVESYIKENKHLPEVPSAKEIKTEGLNLAEMNLLLLKKVEELTLHLIEKEKDIEQLKKEVKELKEKK